MSSLLVGPAPPWRAAPAFIIEHPNHELIAFDLGLSHEVAERGEEAIPPPVGWLMESRGHVGLTLEDQMREEGLSPQDVGYVVLSHLHEDHTGVAAEFRIGTCSMARGCRGMTNRSVVSTEGGAIGYTRGADADFESALEVAGWVQRMWIAIPILSRFAVS